MARGARTRRRGPTRTGHVGGISGPQAPELVARRRVSRSLGAPRRNRPPRASFATRPSLRHRIQCVAATSSNSEAVLPIGTPRSFQPQPERRAGVTATPAMMTRLARLWRRPETALFALGFGVYGLFYQAGGWNQNSRFDLTRALVEDHSVFIDRFANNTGDTARADHFFCDKAPGI